ncbi:hypothetical protein LZK82_25070 (plasmid) [Rhizobium leguminosarum]|uniref:hypothetical protein n=1 Tax=Rhizobium leguminosarum TaxID=384 RepID=UPI0012BCC047|nr:hypothetical protein [Rhizobium leguminosarum]UIK01317.1 hypothetical protein LZK82_25070 [Rhizobium leguminosarum]UIK14230.1 hypothetical protein LZK80_30710 [Rhizobium leguminosarum]UIL30354.1 hypothetical protein LZK75_25395 [Rhizobium leguminosarum]WFT90651.1 hypothetical protein QA638_37155 [Rhizobium leguminosarum]
MPPFQEKLSYEQIRCLVEYVGSGKGRPVIAVEEAIAAANARILSGPTVNDRDWAARPPI